jgi:branched-chain amino acid transport system ATP-binding protein
MTLEVRSLRTGYVRGQTVLDDVSLTLDRGEILGVLGRNGAGKTTLARSIMGLLAPWGGSIVLDDRVFRRSTSTHQRIHAGICLVPENRQIFGTLTVSENLRLAANARKSTAADLERVTEMFPILADRSNQLAAGLSGGQQQMLAIARALVINPEYLIVDEPSLGLAASVVDDLTRTLRGIAEDGVGILLIEQNVGMVHELCESTLVLHGDGHGDITKLTDEAAHELIERVYLGSEGASHE